MTLKELKELRDAVLNSWYDDEALLRLIDEQIHMKENSSYVKLAKCPKCGRKPRCMFSNSGMFINCCDRSTPRFKKERNARIAWNQMVEEKKNEQIN